MKGFLLTLASLLVATQLFAAVSAVIDSGTDLMHIELASKAWVNTGEIKKNEVDDDNNGYVDDINGWNFAENNPNVIDYKYLGTFSKDVYKFFEIQDKLLHGEATAEDKEWMKEKISDQEFVKELMKFANFIHGTHVAGIVARDADKVKIMPAKIIATEPGLPFSLAFNPIRILNDGIDFNDILIKQALGALAKQQMKLLITVAEYVNGHKAQVANCSFGTSMVQARQLVGAIVGMFIQDPSEEDIEKYAVYFINTIIENGTKMVNAAKNTFFVMAAGNDGTDNDKYPVSPANIKMANTISVAASFGYSKIAPFSNFGIKMVEIAAPGVSIKSAIPGNEYMAMAGTSQAAPFVANLAGRLMDINPDLNFLDIKRIMMETVDFKVWLRDKVVSGGIANPERALEAGKLSLEYPIRKAIRIARDTIRDVEEDMFPFAAEPQEAFVLPLQSEFGIR